MNTYATAALGFGAGMLLTGLVLSVADKPSGGSTKPLPARYSVKETFVEGCRYYMFYVGDSISFAHAGNCTNHVKSP